MPRHHAYLSLDPLERLANAEMRFLTSVQNQAKEVEFAAEALEAWAEIEGDDLRSSTLALASRLVVHASTLKTQAAQGREILRALSDLVRFQDEGDDPQHELDCHNNHELSKDADEDVQLALVSSDHSSTSGISANRDGFWSRHTLPKIQQRGSFTRDNPALKFYRRKVIKEWLDFKSQYLSGITEMVDVESDGPLSLLQTTSDRSLAVFASCSLSRHSAPAPSSRPELPEQPTNHSVSWPNVPHHPGNPLANRDRELYLTPAIKLPPVIEYEPRSTVTEPKLSVSDLAVKSVDVPENTSTMDQPATAAEDVVKYVAEGEANAVQLPSHLKSSSSADASIKATFESSVITAGHNVNVSTAGRDVYVYNGVKNMEKDVLNVLNWISNIEARSVHGSIVERTTPGTGTWFLKSSVFLEWLSNDKKLLWGTGRPGAGKTCLTSLVVDFLEEMARLPDSNISVIYVYCRYAERYTTMQILSALLRQLAEKSETVFNTVKEKLYTPNTRHGRKRRPTLNSIVEFVVAGLQAFSKTYVIIDALDELDAQIRHEVVGILEKQFNTPILLTSRMTDLPLGRYPDFEVQAPPADFHAFVRHEISRYGRLQSALSKREDCERVLSEVAGKIEESSDGLFLMAALQVATLKEVVTVKALRQAVDRLPQKSIDDMYKAILQRVQDQPGEMKEMAFRVLGWVVYSRRPLALEELIDALAVEPGATEIDWDEDLVQPEILVASCCGLLAFDYATGTMRFIHVTAHHFLEANGEYLQTVFDRPPHISISEVCVTYIVLVLRGQRLPQEALKALFASRAFLDHACRYMGSYIRLAVSSVQDGEGRDQQSSEFERIVEPLRYLPSLPLLTDIDTGTIDQGGITHFAALNGLTALLHSIFSVPSATTNINEESEQGMTPLFYAGIGGNLPSLALLLKVRGIDVHHKAKGGLTALFTTHLHGQMGARQMLIDDHRARG